MEKVKELIANYSLWGLFIGFATIMIKPFISIRFNALPGNNQTRQTPAPSEN